MAAVLFSYVTLTLSLTARPEGALEAKSDLLKAQIYI